MAKPLIFDGKPAKAIEDEHFACLRKAHNVPDMFISAFDTDLSNQPGGGKGGASMVLTKDKEYIVKEVEGDDLATLLGHVKEFVEHILSGKSLMVPIYALFEGSLGGGKTRHYMAMLNLCPELNSCDSAFDLKGCRDDKALRLKGKKIKVEHRRFYKPHMYCYDCFPVNCATEEHVTYQKGKQRARELQLHMPPAVRSRLVECIEHDVSWLTKTSLMDYSMFITVRSVSPNDGIPANREAYMFTMDGGTQHVVVGIIDFLQGWNTKKKIAGCIKTCEKNTPTIPPPEYGKRFAEHFRESVFVAEDGEADERQPLLVN